MPPREDHSSVGLCRLRLNPAAINKHPSLRKRFQEDCNSFSIVELPFHPPHQALKRTAPDRHPKTWSKMWRTDANKTIFRDAVLNVVDNLILDRQRKTS